MKIGFIDTVHNALWNSLEKSGYTCIHLEDISEEEIQKQIHSFDGIVIRSRIKINKSFLLKATNLKFIARSGAGMENIDLDYCAENNITCFNSPEGNMQAVAEHGLGMLLMMLNKLKQGDMEVRTGVWDREKNRGSELQSKVVGIVGYGNMGKAFAKILSGIGCTVIAYDKYLKNFSDQYVQEVSLTELYSKTDVLSLHLPLTKETYYWLDDARIEQFKNPFYLLNTARGNNVKTEALVNGLRKNKVVGACLDVLEYEKASFEMTDKKNLPEPWQYLVKSEKVLFSPHVAGWTSESYVKLSTFLADKIISTFGTFK